jgi:hypothetical protein
MQYASSATTRRRLQPAIEAAPIALFATVHASRRLEQGRAIAYLRGGQQQWAIFGIVVEVVGSDENMT